MIPLIRKLTRRKLYPTLWTILTVVLLCLPGSALPSGGLFSIKHLDKVAHIVLFGGIVLLWGFFLYQRQKFKTRWLELVVLITAGNIVFGIIMEYIQRDYIPNRSFDVGDILADAAGSIAVMSYLVLRHYAAKKRSRKTSSL